MVSLGPTGRTQHTDDDLWPSSRVRPYGTDKPVSPTVVAVQELNRVRFTRDLLKWTLICITVGLTLWVLTASIWDLAHRDERNARVRACAAAMAAREHLSGPVAQCSRLSASERQEAAYEYGQMKGLW